MKITKKCKSTQYKINNQLDKRRNKRRSSAGLFNTSSAGAVTSLILMLVLGITGATNLLGLGGSASAADNISLTVDTNNLTINMAPMSSSGEFAKSGNMNISVSTTGESGYTLSIASSTGSTDLKSSQNTIGSISAAIDESTFSNSANTQYNNKWGYKPSNLYNSSTEQIVANTNFRPLPGTSGEIIAKTACANGTSPCTSATDNYSLSIAARTTITTPIGDYVSDTFVIAAVANRVPLSCDSTKLCIEFYGNGLTMDGASLNRINYDKYQEGVDGTEFSYSENFANFDSQAFQESYYYEDTGSTTPVTIEGAAYLWIPIAYGLGYDYENDYPYDILGVAAGDASVLSGHESELRNAFMDYCDHDVEDLECYDDYFMNELGYEDIHFLAVLVGSPDTSNFTEPSSWATDYQGDTVTFVFVGEYPSVTGQEAYGYIASIESYQDNVCTTISGDYIVPTGTNARFFGWSYTPTTPGAGTLDDAVYLSDIYYSTDTYCYEADGYNNGDTETLYAVWQREYDVTFAKDDNVSSITILDSEEQTVGTITSSGQSLALYGGNTYTIIPTFSDGYTMSTISKSSGEGTIIVSPLSAKLTMGGGSATINVTSKVIPTFDQAFASAGKTKYNGYYKIQDTTATICSNAEIGAISEVIDARDDSVYKISKLADNNCWMLDNLRLDITNSTIMNGLTTTNTHVDAASLTSLKSGNRSAGNQYASSGFVKWDSSSSSSVYNQAKANADYKDTTTTSYGAGSGKIGVYYNYCAASAGSYCYDSGAGTGNAQYDLCPAGWRMPTGGSSGEYRALYNAYSSFINFRNVLSTPLSGFFELGSATNQGDSGYFWSSTRNDGSYMYSLNVNSDIEYYTDYLDRDDGYSVRCILGS